MRAIMTAGVICWLVPGSALAQTPTGAILMRIAPGQRVQVHGPDIAGELVSADGTRLVVKAGRRTATITRAEVRQVDVATGGPSVRTSSLKGVGLGAVIGGLIIAVLGEGERTYDSFGGALTWGLSGAAIVAVSAGTADPYYSVVYRSVK